VLNIENLKVIELEETLHGSREEVVKLFGEMIRNYTIPQNKG